MTEPTSATGIIPLAGGFAIVIGGAAIAVWLKRLKAKLRKTILRGPEG
jgi:hypothetical protein